MNLSKKRFEIFFSTLLVWFAVCLVLLPEPVTAQTYFVDAVRGNDSFPGTSPESPWKSLRRVSTFRFLPGDQILLRRGQIWHEQLSLMSSGTKEQPIVVADFGDAENAPPRIDGTLSSPFNVNWIKIAGNLYTTGQVHWLNEPGLLFYKGRVVPPVTTLRFNSVPASLAPGAVLLQLDGIYRNFWMTSKNGSLVSGISFFKIDPEKQVYVRQIENGRERQWPYTLGKAQTVKDMSSLVKPGDWYWNPDEKAVYLYSDVPPAAAHVKLSRLGYGLRIFNASFVNIRNIAVSGFNEMGIMVCRCNNVVLQNVYVSGIGSEGHKSGVLFFNANDCSLIDSTVESILGSGVVIYSFGPPGPDSWAGSWNNTIRGNYVHDTASAGIGLWTDFPKQNILVQNNKIIGNTIENANTYAYDGAGIYALFVGQGNIIRDNTIRACGSNQLRSAGIMLDTGTGSTLMEKNTIEGNSNGGIVVTGPGHTIQFNTIINNGAPVWDSAQIVLFPVRANASCTIIHNSIEAGPGQKLILKTKNPQFSELPSTLDYNAYRAADPDNVFCWSDNWSCSQWVDFYNWKNMYGFDIHSSMN